MPVALLNETLVLRAGYRDHAIADSEVESSWPRGVPEVLLARIVATCRGVSFLYLQLYSRVAWNSLILSDITMGSSVSSHSP